jgi:hypothetical protein
MIIKKIAHIILPLLILVFGAKLYQSYVQFNSILDTAILKAEVQELKISANKISNEEGIGLLGLTNVSINPPWAKHLVHDEGVYFTNDIALISSPCDDLNSVFNLLTKGDSSTYDSWNKLVNYRPKLSYSKILLERSTYLQKIMGLALIKETFLSPFNEFYSFIKGDFKGYQFGSPTSGNRLKLIILNKNDECSMVNVVDTNSDGTKMAVSQEEIVSMISSLK